MSLGWVSAGISAVGAIGGMIAGHKQQKAADKAADQAYDLQRQQLALNQQQADMANDQYQDYKSTYRPLEHQMVDEAQNYDTPEAYARAAAEAQGTVGSQLGLMRDRLMRRPGYDPSSAAAQASSSDLELQGAAMGAQAQNAARNNVRNTAWARKVDALGLGKGLVANASSSLANAANGFGNASMNSSRLADAGYQRAGQTAQNVGGMITGLGNLGVQAYNAWQRPGVGLQTNNNASAGNFIYQPQNIPIDGGGLQNMDWFK